jgi:hypothetical protein
MKNQFQQYLLPTILLLVIFGFPIWDILSPMQGSKELIEKEFGRQYAWCVAFSYSSNSNETVVSRVYILFPEVFSKGSIVSVTSVNGQNLNISVNNYAALFVLFVYGNICFAYLKSRKKRILKTDNGQVDPTLNS